MQRSALRNLLRNLLAASLPLASAACSERGVTPPPAGDMASAMHVADAATMSPLDASMTPPDFAVVPDLAVGGDLAGCPPLPEPTFCDFDRYVNGPVPAMPTFEECKKLCETEQAFFCSPVAGPCNRVHCEICAIGRRPATLVEAAEPSTGSEVGRFFARVAHLEAASIDAFETLASDLRRLGAPAELAERAERAAGDERRHAMVTAEQARRFGAAPAVPVVLPAPPRDLEALALENAVEGCVRETFGALVAGWQGRAAGDPTIRALMADIAEDETRHAELSFAIADWAEPRLDPAVRARLAEARSAAARSLVEESRCAVSPELVALAGLPVAPQALFLATRFAAALAH